LKCSENGGIKMKFQNNLFHEKILSGKAFVCSSNAK
jgi:hypothetical protein